MGRGGMNPNNILWGLMLLLAISYMGIWIAGYLHPELKREGVFNPFESLLMLVTGILAFWGIYLMGIEEGIKKCSKSDSQNNKC